MLFILTGDIQTGKTRWLCSLVRDLETRGVPVAGVVAPGVWRVHAEDGSRLPQVRCPGLAGSGRYEKLGIDNVLLPEHERVAFARRRDIALAEGRIDPQSQSERAQLGWAMSDEAIARVDRHFEQLESLCAAHGGSIEAGRGGGEVDGPANGGVSNGNPGLLVVDELGRLELMWGAGLVHAVELLGRGPTKRWPHALIVVRADLYAFAEARFSAAWGGALAPIGPSDIARERICSLFGI